MVQLPRYVICSKDIELFYGKSRYAAYRVLVGVKKDLNKSKKDPVTIQEFCKVKNIDIELMLQIVRGNGAVQR
jgi:hypothetical protein